MNESAEVAAESTASAPPRARARVLGAASMIVGAFSAAYAAVHALLPVPMPSTFPWPWFGASLAGTILAIVALRTPQRGRVAAVLAFIGLALSLVLPVLVALVFVYYLNWSS
ncbi:MAG TPA: hypothetical protein VGI14_18195 [Casimicrobiaceae bacterium]|jgi:hypothetical protein